jgi:hypothetical protein
MAIWTALEGWKTYIVVALFMMCVVAEKMVGLDIPCFNVGDDWLTYVMNALGLGAIRAAISGK